MKSNINKTKQTNTNPASFNLKIKDLVWSENKHTNFIDYTAK
jgi:hypothetical protein